MDTLFLITSKLVWMVVRPESWIIIALLIALIATIRGSRKWALRSILTLLAFLLIIGNWSVWYWLMEPLEARYPAGPEVAQVDGVIVLGGAELAGPTRVWGRPQFDDEGERFSEAVALARQHPEAKLVFTGGTNALMDIGKISTGQSDMAQMFFAQQGIASDRVTLESASRNTAENAAYSLTLLNPQPDEVWILVTSAFHMPRSVKSFERAGWPEMIPWPVDHRSIGPGLRPRWDLARNLDQLNVAVREYIGLLAYDLAGK